MSLVLFFLWTCAPVLYLLANRRAIWHLPDHVVYLVVYPLMIWVPASICLVLIYLARDAGLLLWGGLSRVRRARPAKTATVEDPGRRRLLRVVAVGLPALPLGLATRDVVQSARINVNDVRLRFARLPAGLRGLRLAHLSDIHCSRYTTREDIDRAVSLINDSGVDLVLLTGDYVRADARYCRPCAAALEKIECTLGVYATLGNHDLWSGPGLITDVFRRHGVAVLRNAGITVNARGERLSVLGVDDSHVGKADLGRALSMVEPGSFSILLSHQPAFWDVAQKHDVDLTLAGHTHGGQIGLDLFGHPLPLGALFHRYNQGLFSQGSSRLFVSTGFGYTGPPIRLNIPPEVVILTLT